MPIHPSFATCIACGGGGWSRDERWSAHVWWFEYQHYTQSARMAKCAASCRPVTCNTQMYIYGSLCIRRTYVSGFSCCSSGKTAACVVRVGIESQREHTQHTQTHTYTQRQQQQHFRYEEKCVRSMEKQSQLQSSPYRGSQTSTPCRFGQTSSRGTLVLPPTYKRKSRFI